MQVAYCGLGTGEFREGSGWNSWRQRFRGREPEKGALGASPSRLELSHSSAALLSSASPRPDGGSSLARSSSLATRLLPRLDAKPPLAALENTPTPDSTKQRVRATAAAARRSDSRQQPTRQLPKLAHLKTASRLHSLVARQAAQRLSADAFSDGERRRRESFPSRAK